MALDTTETAPRESVTSSEQRGSPTEKSTEKSAERSTSGGGGAGLPAGPSALVSLAVSGASAALGLFGDNDAPVSSRPAATPVVASAAPTMATTATPAATANLTTPTQTPAPSHSPAVAKTSPATTPVTTPVVTHAATHVGAPVAPVVRTTTPILGEYTDYRLYLKDVYEYRRANEGTGLRPYSYSTFSAAADIKSPNYLKLIIEGRRNLSDDMITRFARALRLNRQETDEFRALVNYGQAMEPIERNQYLKELADLRARRAFEAGQINQASWEKVPGWLGWVLYAMADQANVNFDPQALQGLLRAKSSADEIRKSLGKLIESGELMRNEANQVVKGRDLVESPQDLPVALIRKLQAELIYLGIESLFRDSPKEREFGAMTMAMTEEEFNQARFELRQLRKRLQKDTSVKRKQSKGDRVYQLNIQLFPVTEKA